MQRKNLSSISQLTGTTLPCQKKKKKAFINPIGSAFLSEIKLCGLSERLGSSSMSARRNLFFYGSCSRTLILPQNKYFVYMIKVMIFHSE